jgi:hypothetical protein
MTIMTRAQLSELRSAGKGRIVGKTGQTQLLVDPPGDHVKAVHAATITMAMSFTF